MPKELETTIEKTLYKYPRTWEIIKNNIIFKSIRDKKDPILSIAISNNNGFIATSCSSRCAKIWSLEDLCKAPLSNTNTLKYIKKLECHHNDIIVSIIISKDNTLIVTGSWDKTVKIWNVETGECLSILYDTAGINSVAISNDNSFIVTCSNHNIVKIWDVKTEKCLHVFNNDNANNIFTSVALSNDNQFIVTGLKNHTAKIWGINTKKCLHTLGNNRQAVDRHTDIIKSIAISNDNRFIVTGSYDNSAKVWDVETGQCLHTLNEHTAVVRSVAISSDDRLILTGSDDCTAKIWDIETGQCLYTLQTGQVISIAISNNNRFIFTVERHPNSIVNIWKINYPDFHALIKMLKKGIWSATSSFTSNASKSKSKRCTVS